MDYEQAWNDMKKWLESSTEYMASQQIKAIDLQITDLAERYKNKLDGLDTALGYMNQTERMNKSVSEDVSVSDMIDQWHDGKSDLMLHDFLGLTRDEYALFVEKGTLPPGRKE